MSLLSYINSFFGTIVEYYFPGRNGPENIRQLIESKSTKIVLIDQQQLIQRRNNLRRVETISHQPRFTQKEIIDKRNSLRKVEVQQRERLDQFQLELKNKVEGKKLNQMLKPSNSTNKNSIILGEFKSSIHYIRLCGGPIVFLRTKAPSKFIISKSSVIVERTECDNVGITLD